MAIGTVSTSATGAPVDHFIAPESLSDVTPHATTRPQFDPHGNGARVDESDVAAPSDATGE